VLGDKYNRLLGYEVGWKDASACPLTCFHQLSAEAVASGTLSLKVSDAAKSAANPADTTTLYLTLHLSNSSAL
jgi:hypothetical protein